MIYDIGDGVRVTATFTDLGGNLADPTTVSVTVTSPSGVESTPAIVNPSVGVHYTEFTLTEGHNTTPWWVKFTGTGAVIAVAWQKIRVRVDPV